MRRLLIFTALIALLLPTAAAFAGPVDEIYDDCQDGRLDKKYASKDLRQALEDMPGDVDEYTNCREVIRAAQQGVRGGGGSGPGSNFNDAGGYGALPAGEGGLPLGPDSKPIDPKSIASDDEKADLDRAQKGEELADRKADTVTGTAPRSAGVAPSDSGADVPTPLIVLLALIAAGAFAALIPRVKELVDRRSA